MKTSNVTITIDANLVREAKAFAARRGTSLDHLVVEQLEKLVRSDQAYTAAKRRALARLGCGYDLGWERPSSRIAAHDRESMR